MTSRAAPERDADRAALRDLLCADGIFRSTPDHPIVSHDGSSIAWMLDSQRISLTAPGAALAARCLLDQLEGFESTQIATYGVTAIPLLQACVMASGGRHTGLVIRKARKGYGSMKLIEGPLDRDRPVVMLDDSIASGSSIFRGLEILEAAGLRVEGAVVLVRFGWYGGYARLIERGLHVASVFDVHTDLVPIVEPTRPRPAFNPSLALPAVRWADDAAPDGLHPAALARLVMTRHLAGEPVPRPPARLDDDHDSAGGAWVSVRSRANVHLRHGRDGQWIFPGEPRPTPGEAVVRAALRTATRLPSPRVLDDSAIAVTFFGALETCTVGDLDNDRYGIVVRSAERVERLGGALPRMPGMTRTWAQFEHARTRNAKLLSFEPYVLYRHTVAKAVEPGEAWQPTGVPRDDGDAWYRDPARAGRIAA
ncbi:MAG: hypothetical protein KC464_22255, partial [Myxococcales bacterium]|nr:hypothetical protein [Myxococcales bacterium]